MNRPAEPLLLSRASADWPQRNQAWLARRFAFWAERIQATAPSIAMPTPDVDPGGDGFEPAAAQVASRFALSTFERELLVLAAGIEVDARLREAVAAKQKAAPNAPLRLDFALALALLPEAHWDALAPLAPLRFWSMLDVDTSPGLLRAGLRIDERLLHHLTDVAAFDERLLGIAKVDDTPAGHAANAELIAAEMSVVRLPLVMLVDSDSEVAAAAASARGRSLARSVCAQLGLRLLWVDSNALAAASAGDPRHLATIARALDREAGLIDAAVGLAVETDAGSVTSALRLLGALRTPVLLAGALAAPQLAALPERKVLRYGVPQDAAFALDAVPAPLRQVAAEAMQQFRVGPASLEQALRSAARRADASGAESALWAELRESARGGLDTLAQRIETQAAFSDLVLPPLVSAQLREIAGQLRHRDMVHRTWGFAEGQSRGLGMAALFAGESGTGKTLAAEAIANEARLDLYRIDLARLVSKYIGETEKNLSQVFDAAERSGAVLLFDEADALFGKRSEVKDSHDRYANIEVAYLLQRMESYRGLAILTTNLRSAIDRAFLRRIRFVVQFPFPDAAARAGLWARVFPSQVPTRGLDAQRLARLHLSGGSIRNIAIHAAFIAAARGGVVDTEAITAAARAEFAKLERPYSDAGLQA